MTTPAKQERRKVRRAADYESLAESDAHVAIIAGRPEDMVERLEQFAAISGCDPTSFLQRRSPGSPAGSLTLVDVDHPVWHRVAWLSLGDGSSAAATDAGAGLARGISENAALVHPLSEEQMSSLLTGWQLGGYTFSLKSRPSTPAGELIVIADADVVDAVERDAQSVWSARDLINTPSNIKSPQWFVEQAQLLCAGTGLRVSVMDEATLAKRKFGGLLAVGDGSAQPPRLLTVTKRGAADGPVVLLVGKGITFDSGGLSIKPADSMTTMKTDMSGAAAVLGTLLALATQPGAAEAVTVVGLMPLAENMPSGSAYRPGDVVRHYGGTTSEISNTDAEGRLVLADALAYGVERYNPDVVVDIATLTGAATLGLSREYAALYATDDALAAELIAAGQTSGDQVWQMPLAKQYERFMDSPIADVAQSPTDPHARAGSITAALFLKRFVGDARWAHLDIAGPARSDKPRGIYTPGGTGFGVRLLTTWLREFDTLS